MVRGLWHFGADVLAGTSLCIDNLADRFAQFELADDGLLGDGWSRRHSVGLNNHRNDK